MNTDRIRDWPKEVVPSDKHITRKFIAHYRAGFDAAPGATFCAGEIDGITIVIARGKQGERLQAFVTDVLEGVVQRVSE